MVKHNFHEGGGNFSQGDAPVFSPGGMWHYWLRPYRRPRSGDRRGGYDRQTDDRRTALGRSRADGLIP